jgi:hypothetical protein
MRNYGKGLGFKLALLHLPTKRVDYVRKVEATYI